jgi:uncharacterized glyoxalase superfamily protein PhnB
VKGVGHFFTIPESRVELLVLTKQEEQKFMKIKPIPDGYHTITPFLSVHGVAQVIEFLKKAFNAEEIEKYTRPDGSVVNAEIKIGNSMVMLSEKAKDQKVFPAMLYMYVENVDSVYLQAIQSGGKAIMEPMDQFYGDRSGGVEDAAGNQWWIATRKENISTEELSKRASQKQ